MFRLFPPSPVQAQNSFPKLSLKVPPTRTRFHAFYPSFLQQHPARVTSSSAQRNICCSEGTYVHRTDICDRGFVFLALFAQADGPLFSLKWARPRRFPPSTFGTAGARIDTQPHLFPPVCIWLPCYTSHYTSLFPSILRLSLLVCQTALLAVQ